MDFVKRKIFRRNTSTSSEGDIVYQSWLLQLPPARGLKKYLNRNHWRWVILRYTGPQEGVMEMYTNASCIRRVSKIRIFRKCKVESGMCFNPGGSTNQLNMFCIKADKQVHYMVAETQAQAEQWVLAICATCGLDIPRRQKSPSPSELRSRTKSDCVPTKRRFSSGVQQSGSSQDTNYILLSDCYLAKGSRCGKGKPFPLEKGGLEGQDKNILCFSSNNLNYDHPRPMSHRIRSPTSPDLRMSSYEGNIRPDDILPNFCTRSPRIDIEPSSGMRRFLNTAKMHLPIQPFAVSSKTYDIPPQPTRKMYSRTSEEYSNSKPSSADVDRARAEARSAAAELEDEISEVSESEMLKDSLSPVSSEAFAPDFFPFGICPPNPPPRPPKPPHLRTDVNLWNSQMIPVDLLCPIYDILPKPRPVTNLPPVQNERLDGVNNDSLLLRPFPFQRSISSEIDVPPRRRQEDSQTLKISPNTMVQRPTGDLWGNIENCLKNIPKSPSRNNGLTTAAAAATNEVVRRRRPPTPPSQNLKHSFFAVDINSESINNPITRKRMSQIEEKVQPLTQKQRISICNEVNYLDLAFTADVEECGRPLTRETVYYSVDFIRTWGFNETRQNVEETYRNT